MQHQTPSTCRSRSDTWLGKDRGVNQPVGLFPVLVPWGTAPCKTCSQLLQIAQPPKMHVFVSGVLELKSNTSAFTSICGHSWSLPDIRRISLLGSEILPQSIEYPISQCPGKTAFVVKYFLWRCLPSLYRPSTKATVSPPLDHEDHDTGPSEPRCLPSQKAERMPTPKPNGRHGRKARFSNLFPRRLEQIEPHVARH